LSILRIKEICKSFKSLQVINRVSLEVEAGERHVIIGPNGAGKTTLFNCITGFLPIDEGAVYLEDKEISRMPSHKLIHLGLARTFQKNNLFGGLTVEQNIRLALTSRKKFRYQLFRPMSGYADLKEETEALLDQWGYAERRSVKVENLSYGEQRMLEVILAMALNPKVLLLDEPTSGMSVVETAQITEMIKRLPRTVSLLVIEHDMDVVFSIADRITVIHHGEVILSGSPEQVRNDEQVRKIYFGGGARAHA